MNFMIQECIEKQIKINMNEEIKKELLKDFEFYYNQYVTLKKFIGMSMKNEFKLKYIKETLGYIDKIKEDNLIPLIQKVIPIYRLTLEKIIEFPIIENYYFSFISELQNNIMHKFIEQIEEIKLLKENEINLIKNMIISELYMKRKLN